MTETSGRRSVQLRWLLEALLSIFVALLIVSINQMTQKSPWTERLYFHYYPTPRSAFVGAYGFALAGFILVWVLAAALFLFLRATSRFSFTEVGLRTLGGVVAVAGYPLATFYMGGSLLFVELEAAIAIIFAVLYACRRWPFSRGAGVLLLTLHFGFWSSGTLIAALLGERVFGSWPGWLLLWPDWYWHRSSYAVKGLIFQSFYPLLALSCTLVWISFVRRSAGPRPEPVSGSPSA